MLFDLPLTKFNNGKGGKIGVYRCQVVERRARFELQRAERREHLVEGLLKAQAQLDRVVASIRAAKDGPAAAAALQQQFGLSPEQVDASLLLSFHFARGAGAVDTGAALPLAVPSVGRHVVRPRVISP